MIRRRTAPALASPVITVAGPAGDARPPLAGSPCWRSTA